MHISKGSMIKSVVGTGYGDIEAADVVFFVVLYIIIELLSGTPYKFKDIVL